MESEDSLETWTQAPIPTPTLRRARARDHENGFVSQPRPSARRQRAHSPIPSRIPNIHISDRLLFLVGLFFALLGILLIWGDADESRVEYRHPGQRRAIGATKPVKPPRETNFLEVVDLFCRGSQVILLDKAGLDTWFVDTDINSAVIVTMLNGVPLNLEADKNGDVVRISKLEAAIGNRESSLLMAKDAFKKFLDIREILIHDVISDHMLWTQFGYEPSLKRIFSYARDLDNSPPITTINRPQPSIDDPDSKNRTFGKGEPSLAEMLREFAGEIAQSHYRVWTRDYRVRRIKQYLAATRRHFGDVRRYEAQVIKGLKEKSSRSYLWNPKQHGDVMWQFTRKLIKLEQAYEETTENLKEIVRRVNKLDVKYVAENRTYEEALVIWRQSLRNLMQNWGALLINSPQGVLYLLRKQEVGSGLTDEVSWEKWKQRNCGGTSCYDVAGLGNWFKGLIGMSEKPTAGRAHDESEFSRILGYNKKPLVWRAAYEKACCQDGEIARFLKHGPSSSKTVV
ncbi:uncharacterized protein F4822DRAFT_405252 [Hypoxylon trugodes]|uniref:uncharacterized protein n=1 Tax=Hypoxylon trugodes TaxID=326681 RepID=UPI002196EE2B|nr:uncharacterized protein F4822DRAFT_405252 [Hypoxylon trugodes]KAI1389180.1 hypothetical protein F4822DRAFT_405252 [Hypoxylon trugodes]